MKKLIIGAALLLMAGSAFARPDRKYGPAGCGLGNHFFGRKDNQVIAATTNGTSGNQTFGISSGTSNCTDEEPGTRRREAKAFINLNRELLATDAARGQGEYLDTLADILGAQDKAAFSRSVQARYVEIFSNGSTTETVVDSMTSLL